MTIRGANLTSMSRKLTTEVDYLAKDSRAIYVQCNYDPRESNGGLCSTFEMLIVRAEVPTSPCDNPFECKGAAFFIDEGACVKLNQVTALESSAYEGAGMYVASDGLVEATYIKFSQNKAPKSSNESVDVKAELSASVSIYDCFADEISLECLGASCSGCECSETNCECVLAPTATPTATPTTSEPSPAPSPAPVTNTGGAAWGKICVVVIGSAVGLFMTVSAVAQAQHWRQSAFRGFRQPLALMLVGAVFFTAKLWFLLGNWMNRRVELRWVIRAAFFAPLLANAGTTLVVVRHQSGANLDTLKIFRNSTNVLLYFVVVTLICCPLSPSYLVLLPWKKNFMHFPNLGAFNLCVASVYFDALLQLVVQCWALSCSANKPVSASAMAASVISVLIVGLVARRPRLEIVSNESSTDEIADNMSNVPTPVEVTDRHAAVALRLGKVLTAHGAALWTLDGDALKVWLTEHFVQKKDSRERASRETLVEALRGTDGLSLLGNAEMSPDRFPGTPTRHWVKANRTCDGRILKDAEGVNMATITKFNNFLMNHGLYYLSAIKAAIAQSTEEIDEAGSFDEQSPHELLNWAWVRALGCGTYGQVHLVRRTTDSKIASIKLVQVSQAGAKNMNNDEKRKLLEREMTDASRVGDASPLVASVFAWGQVDPDLYFCVMEACSGGELTASIPAPGECMPPKKFWGIASELIQAVHDIHALGLIHLDLKPQNVLLTQFRRVRVVDFGLARHHNVDTSTRLQTHSGGTEGYIAPEVSTKRFSSKADVYSLAVILMEMACGEKPDWSSDDPLGALNKVSCCALFCIEVFVTRT